MNARTISRMIIAAVLSISTLTPGIISVGHPKVGVSDNAKRSNYTADNPAFSSTRVVIAGAWKIENTAQEAGLNRWRVTSRGTNISGTTLYDCTAKLSLDGSGKTFPEASQKVGDFAPGASFLVNWTVELGKDSEGYEVRWCGWAERDPKKREPGGCD